MVGIVVSHYGCAFVDRVIVHGCTFIWELYGVVTEVAYSGLTFLDGAIM